MRGCEKMPGLESMMLLNVYMNFIGIRFLAYYVFFKLMILKYFIYL